MPDFTFGNVRRFVPVSVRYPWGFYGGPVGYVEEESESVGAIVLDAPSKEDVPCRVEKSTTI